MNEMGIEHQCRICMGHNYNCLNIYCGSSSDQNPIYEVINYVYDLEVSIDDGLPEHVCQDCLRVIKEFKNYKINAHRAKNEFISMREKYYKMPESKIDVCKDSESPHWLQKVNCNGIYHVEYCNGDVIKYFYKEEPEEVAKQSDDEGEVNLGCDSSGIGDVKIVVNYDGDDNVDEQGIEEMSDEGGCSESSMQRDKEEVNGKDYVSCHYCGENRGTLGELHEHIYTLHLSGHVGKEGKVGDSETKEKRFKCNLCDKVFQYQSNLAEHLRDHSSEMVFKCSRCDYRCADRSELRIHDQTHKKENSHICKYCGKSCLYKSHLKQHMRKHTGEKPFKCPYCDYSSALKQTLNTHMRRHTGEKPFKCNDCKFSSYTNRNLKEHMKRHIEKKPYKCKFCEFSSFHFDTLKRHVRKHSDVMRFKCLYCEYVCSAPQYLREHTRKHTGEKPYTTLM